jgi:hypothetical protein
MKIIGGVLYVDRPLTRREWVKVNVFRRRDPRLLGYTGDQFWVGMDETDRRRTMVVLRPEGDGTFTLENVTEAG